MEKSLCLCGEKLARAKGLLVKEMVIVGAMSLCIHRGIGELCIPNQD